VSVVWFDQSPAHSRGVGVVDGTRHHLHRRDGRASLNDIRLAVLGIIVGIGLSVGFGIEASWPWQVAAGIGSCVVSAAAIHHPRTRNWLMSFAHRLTGQ